MAKEIFTNCGVKVNTTDLSDHVRSITFSTETQSIDATTFSTNNFREYLSGFRDWSAEVAFVQDLAAGSTHATLWPIASSSSPSCTLTLLPKKGTAVSATNPLISGTALMLTYQPFSAQADPQLPVNNVRFQGTGLLSVASSGSF